MQVAILTLIAGSFGSPWVKYAVATGTTTAAPVFTAASFTRSDLLTMVPPLPYTCAWPAPGASPCSPPTDLQSIDDDSYAGRAVKVALAFVSISLFVAVIAVISIATLLLTSTSAADFSLGALCGFGSRLGSRGILAAYLANVVLIVCCSVAWVIYIAVMETQVFNKAFYPTPPLATQAWYIRRTYIDGVGLVMTSSILAIFAVVALFNTNRDGAGRNAASAASGQVVYMPSSIAAARSTGPSVMGNPMSVVSPNGQQLV
jgi:hypothetical protein